LSVVTSFAPIENPNAAFVVLGSMPGVASLTAQQYYAHPRNAFWPIMAALFQIDINWPYAQRVKALQQTKVAVWDVLQQCERVGSLDSAIEKDSRYPNDFLEFFKQHPKIKTIIFNGVEAEKSFQQTVASTLDMAMLSCVRLPSTSPAHTMKLADKINAWQSVLGGGHT